MSTDDLTTDTDRSVEPPPAVEQPPVPEAEPVEQTESPEAASVESDSAELTDSPIGDTAPPAESTDAQPDAESDESSAPGNVAAEPSISDESVPDETPPVATEDDEAVVPDHVAPVVEQKPDAASVRERMVGAPPSGGAKAVPSLEPGETAVHDPGPDAPQPPARPPEPTGPVSIPASEDLDSDLEAEIAAAMSGDAATDVPEIPGGSEADATDEEFATGQKLNGVVQAIHGDNVFFDAGLRLSLVVPLRQFESGKHPAVGDKLDITIDSVDEAEGLILASLPRGKRKVSGNWDDLAVGQVVDCLVKATNKGGLDVTVSNLRAFLPASQVDLGYVESLDAYVGQKFPVQLTEVNPKKRNLIVSRRALLIAEREEAAKAVWESLEVGQTFTGKVKTLKDYGAFVDLGGVDGFLHIGQISWSRISHPSEMLQEGQTVDVKVISIDPEKKRIGLGMRQLTQNPWTAATDKYASGRTVSGKVSRLADFGAFVELEPGVEGMIHVSELAWRRVRGPSDVVQVGQEVDVQVLDVDSNRKRIALSLKALQEKPEAPGAAKEEADSEPAPPPRKRREELKGGTGAGDSGGGLFGNPKDFG